MHLYVDTPVLIHGRCHTLDERMVGLGPIAVAIDVASMIGNFIKYYNATRVYFCLDSSEGSWRKHVCPTYKAQRQDQFKDDPKRQQRKEMAEEAIQKYMPELIDLLLVPRFQTPWIEADDYVAALTLLNADKPGMIVTSDSDYWQLVTTNIGLINPVHQYRLTISDHGTVVKNFYNGTMDDTGLTPQQHLLSKAIVGDTSDNLPGLIGVGEKTAHKAIKQNTVAQLITEKTRMVTPRRSKKNPNPQPVHQDANAVVRENIRMMGLTQNEVIEKVKQLAADIESKGPRNPQNNFTKLTMWLEQHGYSNAEIARELVAIYTHQWTM